VEITSPWATDLVISLTSDNTGEATVPSTVTILQGDTSALFIITVDDDTAADGDTLVGISADAAGWTGDSGEMTIFDNDSGAGPDTDLDGIDDAWEIIYFGNITTIDGTGDYDGDLLNDKKEFENGTNPKDTDTDDDGLNDFLEAVIYASEPINPDPRSADTDADGLTDGVEINTYFTYPNDSDSDNDGLLEGEELDGSYQSKGIITDPTQKDTDNDGMDDKWEIDNLLDALDLSDALEDPDEDGFTNLEEFENGTDPNLAVESFFGMSGGCSTDRNDKGSMTNIILVLMGIGALMMMKFKRGKAIFVLVLVITFSVGSLYAQDEEAPLLFDDLFDDIEDEAKDAIKDNTKTPLDETPEVETYEPVTDPGEYLVGTGFKIGLDIGFFASMGAKANGYGATVGFGLVADYCFSPGNIIEGSVSMFSPGNSEDDSMEDRIMVAKCLYIKQSGKMFYGGGIGTAINSYSYAGISESTSVMIIEGMGGYQVGPGRVCIEYMVANGSENVSGMLSVGYKYMF